MITEDLSVFVADFGVTAEFGDLSGKVLLDAPDASILSDRVLSTNYLMTFIATDFPGLKHGDWLTIDDIAYQVQSVTAIDDGKIKTASVERSTS